MKNIFKLFFVLSLLTVFCSPLKAQQNISVVLIGPGLDFGDRENSAIYKTMPGEDKILLMEPGIRFGAEVYGNPATSFKFAQSVRYDSMHKLAFSTQIMIRLRLFKVYKHSMNFGFGPSVFYRQTWSEIDGYTDEKLYEQKTNGKFQTRINWVSAELEYNYEISKLDDFSFSIIHLNPEAMGFAFGIKHWFTRKSSHCNTCPSFRN